MNFAAANKLALLGGMDRKDLFGRMGNSHDTFIEIAMEYGDTGFYEEALDLLGVCADLSGSTVSTMIYYYMGYYKEKPGLHPEGDICYELTAKACRNYCFSIGSIGITTLEKTIERNPGDSKAPYYLDNLWYDKKQHKNVILCWQKSKNLDSGFSTVHLGEISVFRGRDR
jgi:hypothetical protein